MTPFRGDLVVNGDKLGSIPAANQAEKEWIFREEIQGYVYQIKGKESWCVLPISTINIGVCKSHGHRTRNTE